MHVEVNADETVNLSECIKEIQELQGLSPTEERITVEDLSTVLAGKGIYLSEKELQETLIHVEASADGTVNLSECIKEIQELRGLSPTADGMVDLEPFKRGVHSILTSQQTGKKVDVSKLDSILTGMGLHLTQEEVQEALKQTLNKDGTVNIKDFMWAIQDLPSFQDKRVDISNLDSVLGGMGIFLSQEELENALKLTVLNEDGTVNLKNFVRACNATLALSSIEGKYPRKKLDTKMFKLPKVTEKHYPQTTSRIVFSDIPSEMAKSKAAKNLNKPQLEAFRNAYDTFSKDFDGTIDIGALQNTAHNLGVTLTEEEAFDELMYADTDGDGKVNFTDFLNIITDSKRFIQAVAPKKSDVETVDARGILFFELLSKLVESSMLPRKTTVNIVSYYRQKFLESTGKRAWRSDSITEGKGHRKKRSLKKSQSTSMSAFAGAARICVMKDKELQSYVEHLQGSIAPSDSPYSQVPIFPLIPNQDGPMKGKPRKDIPKLEQQRKMEPISSFEDHFFHNKRWLNQEPKPSKDPRPSLTLTPQLTRRRRRLTFDNLDEIRQEVKKATDAYRTAIAVRERNKSLKLWRRVRGAEIGLETGNPSFYQTFSTYSWSWNVCQELLTPRELREYDSKLYHNSTCRSSTPPDKLIRAGGRQKGSKK
ncbi:EF-hand calcium-binding domain-containing protein 3 isoform X2 [Rhineura floridana]|uniref:EF-hand calcium-binding domain-containing protein 3 isoform X2 n=1 Tax=Rhineura floridana TaxID=261503 RepID=UPI002AC7F958|nr:EF-hand calcium-binding domain-containing protein 3 isoform X2 [Rhineura floridana]